MTLPFFIEPESAALQSVPPTTKASRLCANGVQTVLTGGLCEADQLRKALSLELGRDIISCENARYAGAIGAALFAEKL